MAIAASVDGFSCESSAVRMLEVPQVTFVDISIFRPLLYHSPVFRRRFYFFVTEGNAGLLALGETRETCDQLLASRTQGREELVQQYRGHNTMYSRLVTPSREGAGEQGAAGETSSSPRVEPY